MSRLRKLISVLIVGVICLGLNSQTTRAAPQALVQLPASEDVFIAASDPNNNLNGQFLFLQSQAGATGTVTNYVTLVKFSGIDLENPIVAAILGLYGTGCGGSLFFDDVRVDLYKVTDDSWSEITLTWNQAGALKGDYLATIDDGAAVLDFYNTWTDSTNGALAQYVQTANLSDGGDGVVSFWLEINATGFTDVVFMDKEYTGDFCGEAHAPFLSISDEIPTAVGLQAFSAHNTSLAWPVAGTGLVLVAGAALLLARRRKKN